MREKPIYRQLLHLALPLIFTNLLQQTYNTVDAVFVGRYIGSQALAAVGTSGYVILILTYFFIGLSMGASITVSQAYGAKDGKSVYEGVHTTVLLSLLSGLLLTVIGVMFSPKFLLWMNVPEDVFPMAVTYLRLYFFGMIPLLLYNMCSGILRAVGDTKTAMYSLIISCCINVVLDYLFIGVLKTGIAGAAVATVIAQMPAALIVLVRLIKSKEMYRFQPRKMHINPAQLRCIFYIGVPAGIQSVLQCFSNIYFQSKVNLLGSDVMAGVTAFFKVDGFIYMPVEGFSLAACSLVGQNVGARQYHKVRKIFRTSSIMCIGVTACVSILLFWGAPLLMRFFNPVNESALYYSIVMLRITVPLYFLYGVNQIFGGVIRGTGESRIPMLIVLICMCGFRIAWSTVFFENIIFLCYAYPLSWIVTWIVFCVYYIKGNWLKKFTPVTQ